MSRDAFVSAETLLESFSEQVLDTMPEDMREEFLDAVAVLKTTKLAAILKGED